MATIPWNFRKQDSSAAAIASAVTYAVQVADGYLGWMRQVPGLLAEADTQPLAGRRLLELGPGPTLGTPVLLACAGADVAVADRFLPPWDPAFHPALFTAMREAIASRTDLRTGPLDAVLAASAFAPAVACHAVGAEQLTTVGGTFDVVVSNAVLEHIEDLGATVTNLAAVTAPGGTGLHQVDLRDHRSFDRPLEYLTLDEQAFETLRRGCACECGAQWRASDYVRAFESAGFAVTMHGNMFAAPAYLNDLRPRLRPEFAGLSEDDLTTISAFFRLTRSAS
ncbi:MAG: methyltransferase domain-containing protein [Vicinamibacterales bacterium]